MDVVVSDKPKEEERDTLFQIINNINELLGYPLTEEDIQHYDVQIAMFSVNILSIKASSIRKASKSPIVKIICVLLGFF